MDGIFRFAPRMKLRTRRRRKLPAREQAKRVYTRYDETKPDGTPLVVYFNPTYQCPEDVIRPRWAPRRAWTYEVEYPDLNPFWRRY